MCYTLLWRLQKMTQFPNLVQLLTQEILEACDYPTPTDCEDVEKVVARRIPQIINHVIDHLSSYAYDTATKGQDLLDFVPDMTEWPPETKQ
jgi:hypothetical protein